MPADFMTVEDVLRKIQSLKKDIEYLRELEEKWREQKSAFPLVCEGISRQIESFKEQMLRLRMLKVQTSEAKQESVNLQEEPTEAIKTAVWQPTNTRNPD